MNGTSLAAYFITPYGLPYKRNKEIGRVQYDILVFGTIHMCYSNERG